MDRISLVKLMRRFESDGYLTILGPTRFPDDITGIPFRLKKYYVVDSEELIEPNLLLGFDGSLHIFNSYNGNNLMDNSVKLDLDSEPIIDNIVKSTTKYIKSLNLIIKSTNSIPIFNLIEEANEDFGK